MRIVMDLKRDAVSQVVLNQLYANTQLQMTFGVIMLALVDNQPRVLTLQGDAHAITCEHRQRGGHAAHPLRPGAGPRAGTHPGRV